MSIIKNENSLINDWKIQQNKIAEVVKTTKFMFDINVVKVIGGCDISFSKIINNMACCYVVLVDYKTQSILHAKHKIVHIDIPYISSFLAFREEPQLTELWKEIIRETNIIPDVILVDGNGIMHCRMSGIACHIGVNLNIPTIGVSKTYYVVNNIYIDELQKYCMCLLKEWGEWIKITGDDNTEYCAIVRTTGNKKNNFPKCLGIYNKNENNSSSYTKYCPIYVSIGFKIDLESAVKIVLNCCTYRIPEPIRQADLSSREIIDSYDKNLKMKQHT